MHWSVATNQTVWQKTVFLWAPYRLSVAMWCPESGLQRILSGMWSPDILISSSTTGWLCKMTSCCWCIIILWECHRSFQSHFGDSLQDDLIVCLILFLLFWHISSSKSASSKANFNLIQITWQDSNTLPTIFLQQSTDRLSWHCHKKMGYLKGKYELSCLFCHSLTSVMDWSVKTPFVIYCTSPLHRQWMLTVIKRLSFLDVQI